MIPDFLRRENRTNTKRHENLKNMLNEYEKHFDDSINTESVVLTDEELVEALKECIETGITFEEMFGVPDGDDIDF